MRHWRTTRNSNVAIQTGSTYTSDSMTHITTIPMANLGFSTTASSQKVPTSVCNIERQQEIAIWPPKPDVVIPPELQQIASKFQRQVRDYRPWRDRIKCRHVIAIMTDNRKWQCGPQNRKYLYIWNYERQNDNSNGKSVVFDHAQLEETDPGRLQQRPTTGNGNIDVLLANHAISGSRSLSQSFG